MPTSLWPGITIALTGTRRIEKLAAQLYERMLLDGFFFRACFSWRAKIAVVLDVRRVNAYGGAAKQLRTRTNYAERVRTSSGRAWERERE